MQAKLRELGRSYPAGFCGHLGGRDNTGSLEAQRAAGWQGKMMTRLWTKTRGGPKLGWASTTSSNACFLQIVARDTVAPFSQASVCPCTLQETHRRVQIMTWHQVRGLSEGELLKALHGPTERLGMATLSLCH